MWDRCIRGLIGASGGMLLMWDMRVVEKKEERLRHYYMACSLQNVGDNFIWAFGRVYGLNDGAEMRVLLEELADLRTRWVVPWCFGGEFNIVRFLSEWFNDSSYSFGMMDFSDFISA